MYMAHFAELDENNNVLRVVVISNADLLDENGDEQESLGIEVCHKVFGPEGSWVQTSYNGKFRKKYAGIGNKYDLTADLFYDPFPPFPSWSLDSNFDWQAPVPRPTKVIEGHFWSWNEDDLNWVSTPFPSLPGE